MKKANLLMVKRVLSLLGENYALLMIKVLLGDKK